MIANSSVPRSVVLHARARAVVAHAAQRASGRERCGVLLGRSAWPSVVVEDAVELANLAPRTERFLLDPGAVVACEREAREHGRELVGFFHTHAAHAPRPSHADRAGAWEEHVVLVATTGGERAYWPSATGFTEISLEVE